jgi:hypothetical protein
VRSEHDGAAVEIMIDNRTGRLLTLSSSSTSAGLDCQPGRHPLKVPLPSDGSKRIILTAFDLKGRFNKDLKNINSGSQTGGTGQGEIILSP